jgi:hypothetical protein
VTGPEENVNADATDPTMPAWDGRVVQLPTPGWLYEDRNNITIKIDASHALAELADSYSPRWRLSLTLNGIDAAAFALSPADPTILIVVSDLVPGRHYLSVVLHVGAHALPGEEVPFFVDRDSEASSFAQVENAAKSRVAEKREALIKWAQRHGKGFTKLRIADDGFGGNALFATQDIADKEVVGVVPYSMTLSPEGVERASTKNFSIMLAALFEDKRVPHEILVCMFLLKELDAGSSSFFSPYLDLLPPPSRLHSR